MTPQTGKAGACHTGYVRVWLYMLAFGAVSVVLGDLSGYFGLSALAAVIVVTAPLILQLGQKVFEAG